MKAPKSNSSIQKQYEQPVCIRFANTLNWRKSARPEEDLESYRSLVSWSLRAGILNQKESWHLIRESEKSKKKAESALSRFIRAREMIYKIFFDIGSQREPRKEKLNALNRRFNEAMAHLKVVSRAKNFKWTWNHPEDNLDWMIWPLVQSAANLLVSSDLDLVRVCPGKGCGWLFVDHSRNGLRKWCDMKECGNRAKAQRHYRKMKRNRA
jgi:predicted RNA-binding Zn ribbon-like protein